MQNFEYSKLNKNYSFLYFRKQSPKVLNQGIISDQPFRYQKTINYKSLDQEQNTNQKQQQKQIQQPVIEQQIKKELNEPMKIKKIKKHKKLMKPKRHMKLWKLIKLSIPDEPDQFQFDEPDQFQFDESDQSQFGIITMMSAGMNGCDFEFLALSDSKLDLIKKIIREEIKQEN